MSRYLTTYGKPRFLGIVSLSDDEYNEAKRERLIVVASHRGEELAEVVGPLDEEQERTYRNMKTLVEHGEGPVRGGEPVVTDLEFLRLPSDRDLAVHMEHIETEGEILRDAQALAAEHGLQIKLVDTETLLDEKKLFFYFTAEQRVDFRTLVKDLARRFRTRIELRQMGVRDEARIIKGLSSCGLPCCCSYWLNQFSPIGIKMVKEQNIALNPAKISGICGRLMCCMAFEHKVYRELWTGMPGPGNKIKTPNGNYVVLSMDIARKAVRCHKPRGGDILVPLGLFPEFKETVMRGEEWELPEEAREALEAGRKPKCGECARRFTLGDAKQGLGETMPGSPEPERRPRVARVVRPLPEKVEGGEDEEKQARKRPPRRRGRRGGKRPEGAGAPAEARTGERPEGPRPPTRHPAPSHRADGEATGARREAAERHPAQADGAAPDGQERAKRKRRRRRPKRPGEGEAERGASESTGE